MSGRREASLEEEDGVERHIDVPSDVAVTEVGEKFHWCYLGYLEYHTKTLPGMIARRFLKMWEDDAKAPFTVPRTLDGNPDPTAAMHRREHLTEVWLPEVKRRRKVYEDGTPVQRAMLLELDEDPDLRFCSHVFVFSHHHFREPQLRACHHTLPPGCMVERTHA